MQRLEPYLGIVAALLLGVFIVAFSNSIPAQPSRAPVPRAASSTLSVVPPLSVPIITLPDLAPAATTSTSTPTPKKVSRVLSQATTTIPAPAAPAQPVAVPLSLISSRNISLDTSASTLRDALVNIICYAPAASTIHSISGSGVIIDPKGIILTNAHIAQYFLLADRGVTCAIRVGSPAVDTYRAALIYISPSWLRTNSTAISQAAPSGTGEYDFALLAITKSATSATLPAIFSAIPLAALPPQAGAPVVVATYGAQFLEISQIQSSLFPTVVFGSVKDVFTFKTNTIDVLALGGSAAAQEGSSGGGVADASGNLVGTITTSTVTGATDTRSVSAITASYIRAEYASEMGSALDILLSEPTAISIGEFATKIPQLEAILTANLP